MVKSYQDALRRLWDGLCDVYVLETAVNKANGRDEPTEVQKLHGEPCRLSFSSISSTTEQDSAPLIQQSVKLFVSKTVEIPAGSKIVVTQEGRTTAYARSLRSIAVIRRYRSSHSRSTPNVPLGTLRLLSVQGVRERF